MHDEKIVIFFKRPVPGKVKTRLAKTFGEENALVLYHAMIDDLMVTMGGFSENVVPYTGYSTGTPAFSLDEAIGVKPRKQSGRNLGEKMYNALNDTFLTGAERAILIGSDIPHLKRKTITDHFQLLKRYHAVIGPTHDGGYYLIGFRRETLDFRLFQDISWSTNKVFSQTISAAKTAELDVAVGKIYRDIDSVEDLRAVLSTKDCLKLLPHLHAAYIRIMENG
jgi:rSAM/selenodomain-associated transferase 1